MLLDRKHITKINDKIGEFLYQTKKIDETEFDAITKFDYLDNIKNSSKKISSFLTIQEGCDKFCHFCVVPFTRGPEYSRPFKKILEEAENLSENGVREITLLGQNVNAYNYENYRLSDLILEIEKLDGVKRIRYTTSHPRDMTEDLINVYGVSKKLMPLVHLPVQSGSDKILNSMNRKHQISDYVNIYKKLQKINPKIKFSSDFIIAYPGEDEKDFNETCDLIKKIKDNGGKILKTEFWGTQGSSIQIKKNSKGYFYMINCECDPKIFKEFDTKVRQDINFIRFFNLKIKSVSKDQSLLSEQK